VQRTSLGGDELPPIGDRSRQLLALLSALDAYEYRIGGGIDAVLDWSTSSDATSSPVLEIWLTKPAPTTVLVELPLRLAAITAAVGDRTRLRAEAHTLRSSAGLVGALALAEACRRLESGGGDPTEVERLAAAANDALRSWLAG
jgi:hypothetical protein